MLDNKYRNVVVELLPQFADQVIFMVSSSQWTNDMDAVARKLIGKEYNLVLEETAEQGAKTPDIVDIQGQEFVLSRYGCDIDRTVIEGVSL